MYVVTEYMVYGNMLNYFLTGPGQQTALVKKIKMAAQVRIVVSCDLVAPMCFVGIDGRILKSNKKYHKISSYNILFSHKQ